jgi:hypothetical protein
VKKFIFGIFVGYVYHEFKFINENPEDPRVIDRMERISEAGESIRKAIRVTKNSWNNEIAKEQTKQEFDKIIEKNNFE